MSPDFCLTGTINSFQIREKGQGSNISIPQQKKKYNTNTACINLNTNGNLIARATPHRPYSSWIDRDVTGISMGTSKVEPESTDEVGKTVEGFQ